MEPPATAPKVQLVRASTHSLELSWSSIPNAQYYLLEVQKLPQQASAAIGNANEKPAFEMAGQANRTPRKSNLYFF